MHRNKEFCLQKDPILSTHHPRAHLILPAGTAAFHRFPWHSRALGSQMGELRALGITELFRNPWGHPIDPQPLNPCCQISCKWEWKFGIDMYALLYFKWITNKALLHISWNSAPQPGWEGSLEENGYMHYPCIVWLSPFTLHLKLSQHC